MDAVPLPPLTRRQEQILARIVRAYTQKAEPVSSKYLAESADLNVSPATIRNEMAVLEELGYIAAPHTSAGRVPTQTGYRYYVKHLIGSAELPAVERQLITERIQSAPMASDQWMRYVAMMLARTTQAASLVTAPSAAAGRFKHLELIAVQGRLVLMVLIVQGGGVHQRMLNLADSIPQAVLSEASARLNALCHDLTANDLLLKAVGMPLLEREVMELAAEVIERASAGGVGTVYRDGLSEVLPAFAQTEAAQQVVRVFEERPLLNLILDEFLGPLANEVQVVIAGEGKRDELSQVSMVLSRYGQPGQLSGAVGLVGPTHLNYGRAISTVRYISTMMTNMLVNLYREESDNIQGADDGDTRDD
jgi:heat-inducible transcriptional repressor